MMYFWMLRPYSLVSVAVYLLLITKGNIIASAGKKCNLHCIYESRSKDRADHSFSPKPHVSPVEERLSKKRITIVKTKTSREQDQDLLINN